MQNLLDEILKIQLLGTSLETRRFLDPHGYSENFYGESKFLTASQFEPTIFTPRECVEKRVYVFPVGAELASCGAAAEHWVAV